MNAQEIRATVAAMPSEAWLKFQTGIAEMLAARFSTKETPVIRDALAEPEAEFARGEVLREGDVRRHFGCREARTQLHGCPRLIVPSLVTHL